MQLQRRQQQRFVAIVVATASLLGLEFAAAFTVAPSSLIRSNGRRHILHGPLLDRPHLSLSAAAALEIIDGETAAATGTEVAKTTTTPLFASSPDSLAILEELGIEDGKLALGLKPAEVLQYIGT